MPLREAMDRMSEGDFFLCIALLDCCRNWPVPQLLDKVRGGGGGGRGGMCAATARRGPRRARWWYSRLRTAAWPRRALPLSGFSITTALQLLY